MSPAESKLFPAPGSFNFSMAALAADPAALASKQHYQWTLKIAWNYHILFFGFLDFNSQAMQTAAEMAGSPQGKRLITLN